MADVNTRIHDFYYRGRQAAVDEIMDLLDRLAQHVDNKPLPTDMTAREFIQSMTKILGEHFGRTPRTRG